MRYPKWLSKSDLDLFPKNVRQIVVNVIALARTSATYARSLDSQSPLLAVRLKAELDQAHQEITLLKEELRIKDARMARTPARQRPHYLPNDRFAIIKLRAARGWNTLQTALRFMLEPETISHWMHELDNPDSPLLKAQIPVSKLPDFSAHLVQQLKLLCPTCGKKRLAHLLVQAGFKLSGSSVARFLKIKNKPSPTPPEPPDTTTSTPDEPAKPRIVAAKYPDHVWHTDLTVVPTSGFWVPWLPFTLPQAFPFAYWTAFILDHFSRRLVAFAVFKSEPTAADIKTFFEHTIQAVGRAPKHLINDQGVQFTADLFTEFCKTHSIKQRFGAVGQHGSIAVIERFIRSFKDECIRFISVPLVLDDFRKEIELYTLWYNAHRPHEFLKGLTPLAKYNAAPLTDSLCSGDPLNHEPPKTCHNPPHLDVAFLEGRRHLPVVTLKHAA